MVLWDRPGCISSSSLHFHGAHSCLCSPATPFSLGNLWTFHFVLTQNYRQVKYFRPGNGAISWATSFSISLCTMSPYSKSMLGSCSTHSTVIEVLSFPITYKCKTLDMSLYSVVQAALWVCHKQVEKGGRVGTVLFEAPEGSIFYNFH